ncbi:hypothetical protein OG896_11870 [Streptomyces sp. NBC_00669]|uniref:hypothetical protein n=1 Tax=Streptomyces sp. NBC_00669 TaxID=2976011 RepID=UPI002E2FDABE|nr:hypothetical protein [Streptomyces sp. NBC_00669]
MSRKWLRAHAPAVAALALALGSIGGTGVAVAAGAPPVAPPAVSTPHTTAVQSATLTSSDSDSGTNQKVLSPTIWFPPS